MEPGYPFAYPIYNQEAKAINKFADLAFEGSLNNKIVASSHITGMCII
jgi:hypothetical protein